MYITFEPPTCTIIKDTRRGGRGGEGKRGERGRGGRVFMSVRALLSSMS